MTNNMIWTGPDVLAATKGEPVCGSGDFFFTDVSIDSRTITPSQLFVAVKGENHDGHDFINDVLKKDVSGFIVGKYCPRKTVEAIKSAGGLCVVADDTVRALGALARYKRRQSGLIIVAITGTNGKTSTKEMTARVLEQQYRVLATAGNYNNEIGVPLTLLRLEKSHQVGVLELGMNAPGEIGRLTGICEPDIGVVLNVGEGHLAGLGDIENVARAKGELIEMMDDNGAAVLNADDPRVLEMAEKAGGRVVTFGQGSQADVRGLNVQQTADGSAFDILLSGHDAPLSVRINGYGNHLVSDALAAAAVGRLLDVPGKAICRGLEQFLPVTGRMMIVRTKTGVNVVDDTYNANPGSMKAAVEAMKTIKGRSRCLVVFGDMYELGNQAVKMHHLVGTRVAESGADMLLAVGDFAENMAEGASDAGMAKKNIFIGTKEKIVTKLSGALQPGDWILVKGSRAMTMETIVTAVVKASGGAVNGTERPE